MGFLNEFKAFASRGNVVDLAVAVVIGGAFGKIVTSVVNDVLMPPIGYLTSGVSFKSLFFALDGSSHVSLEEAIKAGAPVIAYGAFIQSVIDFIIIAFCVFLLVKVLNAFQKKEEAKAPEVPPATPEDILLLREIRDSLKNPTEK
jgi:large conductance mechanosensitive channel